MGLPLRHHFLFAMNDMLRGQDSANLHDYPLMPDRLDCSDSSNLIYHHLVFYFALSFFSPSKRYRRQVATVTDLVLSPTQVQMYHADENQVRFQPDDC